MNRTVAATFVVNTTSDTGAGSLRQAILDSNANPGRDSILFSLPGSGPFFINPGTGGLPAITDPLVLDATKQAGYNGSPIIQLSGINSGSGSHGFRILAGNSVVRGFVINRFSGYGISIEGGASNVVQANFIGTDVSGAGNLGNATGGILLFHSTDNLIGGTNVLERNLISGTNKIGVLLMHTGTSNNVVAGNFIGTDSSGTLRRGNTENGVLISDARYNVIGGTVAGARNLISGNGQSGVYIMGSAISNVVCGNYIGTDISGASSLSNVVDGVTLFGASSNIVGGVANGSGNLISGNVERGVYIAGGGKQNLILGNLIGTGATGKTALGNGYAGIGIQNASNNIAGPGNVISGNKQSGVSLGTNAPDNLVQGNFIGLDATGASAVGNLFHGISIVNSARNIVGGTNETERNVISGNVLSGVYISGTTATNNTVAGNFIGTSVTGKKSLANVDGGIRLEAPRNTIGGSVSGAGNVISGNGTSGVYILNAALNLISGNFIGLDITGTNALGNAIAGVAIVNAASNTIGGTTVDERNLLSGNTNSGIYLSGNSSRENRVQGNFIGTDLTGAKAIPNLAGGIYLYGAATNYLGGSVPGSGNLVSGNKKVAISIGDPGANGNFIQGNWIGVKADGLSALGNEWHGVEILNTSSNNFIGGTTLDAANKIAFAQTPLYAGVRIRDRSERNLIRFNSIFSNAGLGIDLGDNGPAPNDDGDPDTGANDLQNFPVITSVTGRYITTIKGTFNSRASRAFALDFYANPSPDESGYGEGQQWIGQTVVTTGADGNASFSVTFTNRSGIWPYVSSTATAPANNTSEFSLCALMKPNLLDSDGDGMPDEYEIANGFNPLNPSDAALDFDGDGVSNLNEYFAGTDPRDPGDFLHIENFRRANQLVSFDFNSLIGKTYSMQFSTNLSSGWLGLPNATNMAGTGLKLKITDANAAGQQRYYRIRLP